MTLTHRRQPARKSLIIHDLSTRDAAARIGCSPAHLANVLAGRAHPSDLIKAGLPLLIGLPIECLLDAELLDGKYGARGGRKAARS